MLPVTVHGRVSDIWRGYAAQRILNLLNLRLIFSPALVKQVSSSCHPYLNCVAFSTCNALCEAHTLCHGSCIFALCCLQCFHAFNLM
jgi:hypothetical protein